MGGWVELHCTQALPEPGLRCHPVREGGGECLPITENVHYHRDHQCHNQHLHRCEGHHETVNNLQEQKTGHLPAGITCANIANSWSHVLRSSQAGADKVSGENFTAISQEDQSSMLYGHWTFTAVAGKISGAQLNTQWSAINPLVLRQTLNECWAGFCQSDDWPGH